jgi:16S rRNA (guanine1207-N2)-methyltransferase
VRSAIYGAPPPDLAELPEGAVQLSPLVPGSAALEDLAEGSLERLVMLAPAGTLERRYALAMGLRALAPGGTLVAMAPNGKGGTRLRKELSGFGCTVEEVSKSHHRTCTVARPAAPEGLDEAIGEGGPRRTGFDGLWSQPGIFSWDRIDPASALLAGRLPALAGRGADLGCGIGVLARAVLRSPAVTELTLADIDGRAIRAARRNIEDPRVRFLWADVRLRTGLGLRELDFVVMNPPFHHGTGAEDRELGRSFIERAAAMLRKSGVLWLVANRHMPYEQALKSHFAAVRLDIERGGYKVIEAKR